jgi:hypothetical protein
MVAGNMAMQEYQRNPEHVVPQSQEVLAASGPTHISHLKSQSITNTNYMSNMHAIGQVPIQK